MQMILRTILFAILFMLPLFTAHAAPPDCDAAREGTIVYNKQHKLVQFCNGTDWIGMTAKIGGAGDTLADLSCQDGEIVKWNGSAWLCAEDSGGLEALQGTDDPGACTPAKDGLIKYNPGNTPPWHYCDGGTTSWLPFRLPQCQNDDAGECTLAALRNTSDPQFTAANLRCGSQLLGVTGTYGSGSSSAFTFADATNAALSTLITASAVTISGIPAGCPGEVEVSGQGSPQISINGGAWGTTGSIANGQTLAVRLTSSASFSTAHTATISIGSTDDTWSVTTMAIDTTPNAFDFTPNVTNANLSTLTAASAVTISGINTTTPVSVTGAGAQISIAGGAWVTSGNITNGQTLAVRLTSSASFSTAITATVNVGGVTDTWSVTTLPVDTTPDAFDFTPNVTNVNLSTLTTASAVTINGINTTTPVSVTGAGAQISINGGAWGTSGNITNGQTLSVRLTSSTSFSTAITATVDVGGVSDTWSVTTLAADTTPVAFDFTPNVTNAALSTLTTASAVTITGINTTTPVSVTGTGAQISIAGGAWGTSGNITDGQTLAVRLTSSASFNTAITATVNVGGVTDTWSVTTLAADTTPDAFAFTDQTDVALSTLTTSNSITIGGINTTTPVSVSGTGSPQISIAGGAWATSGNITNGQTLAVRLTSSAAYATALTATVNVGGVTDVWSVTTEANVVPGSDSFTTSGSFNFTVPAYNTLTVQVWGAGGGGAGCSTTTKVVGVTGGASSWDGAVIANGGTRASTSAGGAGGTASGGTTNTTGQNGSTAGTQAGPGGDGANGGAGGDTIPGYGTGRPGVAPGGGGAGGGYTGGRSGNCRGSGAGGGGYSARTYSAGTYSAGELVPVVVGARGTGGNGSSYDGGIGAYGRVTITWN